MLRANRLLLQSATCLRTKTAMFSEVAKRGNKGSRGYVLDKIAVYADLSKFRLDEFEAYMFRFGVEWGGCPPQSVTDGFRRAWLRHQHRNPHHWEHWVLDPAKGDAVEMDDSSMREMVADWRAMSRKFGNDPAEWYSGRKDSIVLHDKTRALS